MNLVSTTTAPHYYWSQVCEGWRLLDHKELSIIQERMPPGTSEKPHFHQTARQFFFVLTGQLSIHTSQEIILVKTHQGVEIEPGVVHEVRNESDCDTMFLLVSHPSTKGDRIEI